MNLKTGIVELDPFYQFVRHSPFPRQWDRKVVVPYRQQVLNLLSDVPHDSGWYGWFQNYAPVYIGQAGAGKTSSLNERLKELLLEEYVAFWSSVDEMTELFAGKGVKYRRPLLMENGSSIIWIAKSGCEQGTIDVIEHKLIWDLKPELNEDRRDYSDIELPEYAKVRRSMENAFNVSG